MLSKIKTMNKSIYWRLLSLFLLVFVSCNNKTEQVQEETSGEGETEAKSVSDYDPKRGEGEFNESNVTIGSLDAAMVSKGEAIANTKCFSCHKLTDEKLVGPGWKGVTQRNAPHWILNFITNPDPMIDKDPKVQAQLELCLVRMPNQNLAKEDARQILEFMRMNDGVQ